MSSNERKTLERALPIVYGKPIKNIHVVGAGGNGSYLIPHIARYISTKFVSESSKPRVHVYDGDKVESKNLLRQNFISADIGKNKAEVLVSRYNKAFGLKMTAHPKFVTSRTFDHSVYLDPYSLVITCTDNLKSRGLFALATHTTFAWLDLGNEERGGQVILSFAGRTYGDWSTYIMNNCADGKLYINPDLPTKTPSIFSLYPELKDKLLTEKHITELSCAEQAADSGVQAGFVNNLAAAIGMNYVHALLSKSPIHTNITWFSIDNIYAQNTLTKSKIVAWGSQPST